MLPKPRTVLSNWDPAHRLPRKGEGPFRHQRDSGQRTHHQHSQAHPWSGVQEASPSGTRRGPEICREEYSNSRRTHWHQAQQSHQAEGIKNSPHRIRVQLSRKHNEDEDSPNCILWFTYVLVPAVKNLQRVNVDENQPLIVA